MKWISKGIFRFLDFSLRESRHAHFYISTSFNYIFLISLSWVSLIFWLSGCPGISYIHPYLIKYDFSGWVCFRTETISPAQRGAKLAEAEQYLLQAQKFDEQNSRSYYYLGRCYSEIPDRAHPAFINYRASIDKNEHDADTWCSIGVLYKIQNQDLDALQAFVCAVQINPTHSTAWTNLGRLYESHSFYRDANYCYKKAVINNSCKF